MRVPEGVNTIAIFGRTCVGKSTVAQQLAGLIRWPIRHCGEMLKRRAQTAGTSVPNLSLQNHQEVDNETRRIATQDTNVIIEGGFLDIVLAGLKNTILVRLTCNETEREQRFRSKHA